MAYQIRIRDGYHTMTGEKTPTVGEISESKKPQLLHTPMELTTSKANLHGGYIGRGDKVHEVSLYVSSAKPPLHERVKAAVEASIMRPHEATVLAKPEHQIESLSGKSNLDALQQQADSAVKEGAISPAAHKEISARYAAAKQLHDADEKTLSDYKTEKRKLYEPINGESVRYQQNWKASTEGKAAGKRYAEIKRHEDAIGQKRMNVKPTNPTTESIFEMNRAQVASSGNGMTERERERMANPNGQPEAIAQLDQQSMTRLIKQAQVSKEQGSLSPAAHDELLARIGHVLAVQHDMHHIRMESPEGKEPGAYNKLWLGKYDADSAKKVGMPTEHNRENFIQIAKDYADGKRLPIPGFGTTGSSAVKLLPTAIAAPDKE